jgi:hypothetical protein
MVLRTRVQSHSSMVSSCHSDRPISPTPCNRSLAVRYHIYVFVHHTPSFKRDRRQVTPRFKGGSTILCRRNCGGAGRCVSSLARLFARFLKRKRQHRCIIRTLALFSFLSTTYALDTSRILDIGFCILGFLVLASFFISLSLVSLSLLFRAF